MEKTAAIILAAGSGSRMKSAVPKQYLTLCGKPVIYYSLRAFEESCVDEIVLVAGKEDVEYCRKSLIETYGFQKVRAVVPGGRERYDSVCEGLKAVGEASYVLIHDGARPLITPELIETLIREARQEQACVPAMPVKDTIRVADSSRHAVQTPDRSTLWMIQTPQAFACPLLRASYEKLYADIARGERVPAITDDAMVVEYACGQKVKLVEGSYRNIKITTPEDLDIAESFLNHLL